MFTSLSSRFCIRSLIHEFTAAGKNHPMLNGRAASGAWVQADEASILKYFGDDAPRRRRFLRFSNSGFLGLFLVRDGEWVSYGWATPQGVGRPPHLPRWTAGLGWWIFYCHTRPEFRGQGNYKRLLAELIARISARHPQPRILCDTLPENFASRSAILQTGFQPAGVITAFRILPDLFLTGEWRPEQPHTPHFSPAEYVVHRRAG